MFELIRNAFRFTGKKYHITNAFFVWMVVLSIMSTPTHAREGTVRVGVYDNAPIVFPDKTGRYTGFSVEMLQYVASKEGWQLEYVLGSFSECLKRLEQGNIDIMVYIAYSKARALMVDFSRETLLSNWGIVYTRPGSGIQTILDLEGKRVALMKDSIHPPVFMKLINSFGIHINTIEINDHIEGFRLVDKEKADAVVVNRIFGLSHARKFNVEETNIIFNPIEIRYAAPLGKNGDLLAAVDFHLKALKADRKSIFYQSFNKAFGLNTPSGSVSKWVYWGFFLLLALAGFLGLVNSILNLRVRKKTQELQMEIEARKQAEKAARKSSDYFRTLIKTVPDLVWLKDPDGVFLFCNARFEGLYGAPEKDIVGKTDYDFVDKDLADFFRRHDQAAMDMGKACTNEEELLFASNGHRELVETIKTPMLGSDGQIIGVLGLAHNITRLKESETAMWNANQRFEKVFNSHLDAIFILNSEIPMLVLECNQAAFRIFGYTSDEIIGQTINKLHVNDSQMSAFQKDLSHAIQSEGHLHGYEFSMKRKDGTVFPSEHTVMELKNDEGQISGRVFVVRDLTERKRMETQVQQAQKMESIGILAGGIAHDFNNILSPILGYSEFLLDEFSKDNPVRNGLNEIYSAALRAKDLVRQILSFSRQGSNELMLMAIQPIIKEALKLIRATVPSTIDITRDIRSDCGLINADPTQIHQIIMNLTTNAYHAMEERGGQLRVTLREIEWEEFQSKGHDAIIQDMPPGNYACLTVADTGTGIPEDVKEKIFDPFFTTKEQGKGTGMGLFVVHSIVQSLGGAIRVLNAPGKGTEFHVYLPIAEATCEEQPTPAKECLQGGTERILIVDDEKSIITMEKLLLKNLGYQVISCLSSIEALDVFRSDPDKFDLVITDMAMPDMSGDTLSLELTRIRPDIPIILCTGFSNIMSEEKALSIGIKGFLLKPILVKDLSEKVRSVLDEARGCLQYNPHAMTGTTKIET